MKRKNTLIPTLIALTAACTASQSLQAQTPARQTFPWSSSNASQTASRVSSSQGYLVEAPVKALNHSVSQSLDSLNNKNEGTINSATTVANEVLAVGETIYLDEQGNQITREEMQAKLTAGQNEMISTLPSTNQGSQAIQSFERNFDQRITPQRPADNSMWGKTKSITSKMTAVWKKPSLFKTPEGMTLPSMKTTWAKPKFDEPTTWFSRKTTDPITFASIDSLPRKGQIPTSTSGPLSAQAQFANRSAAPIAQPSFASENFASQKLENVDNAAAKSIFTAPEYEVAEKVDNSFDPRR